VRAASSDGLEMHQISSRMLLQAIPKQFMSLYMSLIPHQLAGHYKMISVISVFSVVIITVHVKFHVHLSDREQFHGGALSN